METDRRYTKININSVKSIFFTSVAINTHRGLVHLDLEPSKEFYKLLARGFKPTSMLRSSLIGRIGGDIPPIPREGGRDLQAREYY
jgi:hypothetical protein